MYVTLLEELTDSRMCSPSVPIPKRRYRHGTMGILPIPEYCGRLEEAEVFQTAADAEILAHLARRGARGSSPPDDGALPSSSREPTLL